MRSIPKTTRRHRMTTPGTSWEVYAVVRGDVLGARVNSKENPPFALLGITIDYDSNTPADHILRVLKEIKEPNFVPNFIERTLSDRVRLLYLFEIPLLLPNTAFARTAMEVIIQKLNAPTLLAGYDKKSADPYQLWTNGGVWISVKETPMPRDLVVGFAIEAGKKTDFGSVEIPLPKLAAEFERRWPGRWKGPFELDFSGARVWDPTADNLTGCQIKPDGMLCFTGDNKFEKWEHLFGSEWCANQKALNLGAAAADVYFDGNFYWRLLGVKWRQVLTEDLVRHLKGKGFSARIKRGETASEIDRILIFIQESNRVDAALPIINRRPGITIMDGYRVLNTSTIVALAPATGTMTPEVDFPYTWAYLHGLLEPEALDYFLAWLQRFYVSILEYQPLMGQAIFLCGPANNGKSLLGCRIIKPLVGNRAANPYDYLMGKTLFNADLFNGPLLMINDEDAPSDFRERLKFLTKLKSLVVNPSQTYHRKYGTPFSVECTWRLFTTLNDDPGSVGLLPEVHGNTADKMMFFRSRPHQGTWEPNAVIEAKIDADLPKFARWLLDWKPPESILTGGRMGVKSYFDKDIYNKAAQQNAHYELVEILGIWFGWSNYWIPTANKLVWVGNPSEFYNELANTNQLESNLKSWTTGRCAHALHTLARNADSGVEYTGTTERTFKITRAVVQANVDACRLDRKEEPIEPKL